MLVFTGTHWQGLHGSLYLLVSLPTWSVTFVQVSTSLVILKFTSISIYSESAILISVSNSVSTGQEQKLAKPFVYMQ
jgi:hypothetical protein